MEWNPETQRILSQFFLDTVSPEPERRRRAEQSLSGAADKDGYGVAVLQLVAEPAVDEKIRRRAAVNIENHLKNRWAPSSSAPLPDGEKEQIKAVIVRLMLGAAPKIQAHLRGALAVIGNHEESFADDEILQGIVIPTVMIKGEEEAMFEMRYKDFIRRDMEERSGGVVTSRRIACELLKGVAGKNKERINAQILRCVALFDENPAAYWKYKECAIYLAGSLATKRGSVISSEFVDVEGFLRSVIVPVLRCEDVNAYPMLKAGALRFLREVCVLDPEGAYLDDLVRFLGSVSKGVCAYAAICIEKLAHVKHNEVVQGLCVGDLMGAMENPPDSEGNEYVMRCVVRVLQIADISSSEMGLDLITRLMKVLDRVRVDPKNPAFNHYLFAAIATLVRRACEKHPSLVDECDQRVLWRLERILDTEGTQFLPYAFQLFAELVDLNRPSLPERYLQLFVLFEVAGLWQMSENVPALVRLFQSYLQKAPGELEREGRMGHVVMIFKYLMSSPSTAELGVDFIEPVLGVLRYDVIKEHLGRIWYYMVMGSFRTQTIVTRVIIMMSLFLTEHGPEVFMSSMGPNIFRGCMAQLWTPHLETITGYTEVKLCAIASTKLLVNSLTAPGWEQLWGELLESLVTLLTTQPLTEEESVAEDHEPDFDLGEASAFTHLLIAPAKTEIDGLFNVIGDPKSLLAVELAHLSSRNPGKFWPLITRYLSPDNLAQLLQLCNSHHVTI